MYYSIIEKNTGKMPKGISNVYKDSEIHPINDDNLMFVPLDDELGFILTDRSGALKKYPDIENSYYDFSTETWTVVYYPVPDPKDILSERIQERSELLSVAQNKLLLVDVSDTFKQKIQEYINDLNSIDLEKTLDIDQIWPKAPF